MFGSSTTTASPFGNSLTGGISAFGGGSKPFGGGHPPIKGISSKPAKPFGAPASDGEDGENGEDGDDAGDDTSKFDGEVTKKDKRFFEQECKIL